MSNRRAKKSPARLKMEAVPHLFVVVGFFGAALSAEVMTIVHEMAKGVGGPFYWMYAVFIVFVAWPWFILEMLKIIDNLYSKS